MKIKEKEKIEEDNSRCRFGERKDKMIKRCGKEGKG